ncbi:MAG: 3-isopropylmalate dehydrogenase, partial [Pelagibacterales bacterium]|nr:3-isopropylmalate dehydrogenase [Pelagibacterales bacterium]
MSKIFKLLILPGDGIGPEVMTEVTKLISAVEKSSGAKFEITYDDIGGAAYDRYGTPLADSTL